MAGRRGSDRMNQTLMDTPSTLQARSPTETPRHTDLEVKDAQLIFERIWNEMELEFGREPLPIELYKAPLAYVLPDAGKYCLIPKVVGTIINV